MVDCPKSVDEGMAWCLIPKILQRLKRERMGLKLRLACSGRLQGVVVPLLEEPSVMNELRIVPIENNLQMSKKVVSYNAESCNLFFDFFDISVNSGQHFR